MNLEEIYQNGRVCVTCHSPATVSINEKGPARFYCVNHINQAVDMLPTDGMENSVDEDVE